MCAELHAKSECQLTPSSVLDVGKKTSKWRYNATGNRPPRLQGQTSGKHHGCFPRCRESQRPRHGDGYTLDQGRRSSLISCKCWAPGTTIEPLTERTTQDANLKRCFGKEEKIIDCTWEYISEQRTLAAPHEPMPRLKDLLEFLASPGLENVWLLLDIKVPTMHLDPRRF